MSNEVKVEVIFFWDFTAMNYDLTMELYLGTMYVFEVVTSWLSFVYVELIISGT